jgi:MYND finger
MECLVCRKKAAFQCGGCNAVSYCSSQCRQLHWNTSHSVQCARVEGKRPRDSPDLEQLIEQDNREGVLAALQTEKPYEEDVPIEKAKTVEMARILYEYGANPYRYVGGGNIALDEMVKFYNIREFMKEAHEEMPAIVSRWLRFARRLIVMGVEERPILLEDVWIEKEVQNLPGLIFGEHTPPQISQKEWTVDLLRHCMYNGLFPIPHYAHVQKHIEDIFFRRYNDTTLEFWTQVSTTRRLRRIQSLMYLPGEDIESYALNNSFALPLLLFAPEKLYANSHRPKTAMKLFQIPTSHLRRELTLDDDTKQFMVTRYAQGMYGGLYHMNYDEQEHCGTFYYFEPESETILTARANKVLYAKDKIEAFNMITRKVEPHQVVSAEEVANNRLYYTPMEFIRKFGDLKIKRRLMNKADFQGNRQYYCAHVLNVYANQDEFDQVLCKAARKKGYEIVVLEDMVGARQIVTEILDVRLRKESFEHLYFP